MKIFPKGYELNNCEECGVYGLMQHYTIKFKDYEFHYLLCEECIKTQIHQNYGF